MTRKISNFEEQTGQKQLYESKLRTISTSVVNLSNSETSPRTIAITNNFTVKNRMNKSPSQDSIRSVLNHLSYVCN